LFLGTGENAANPWVLNRLGITHVVNAGGLPHGAWEGSRVGRVGEGLNELDALAGVNGDLREDDAELGLKIARMIVAKEMDRLDMEEHGSWEPHSPDSPTSPRKRRRSSLAAFPDPTLSSSADPNLTQRKVQYLNVAIRDTAANVISAHFREVTNFIDTALSDLGEQARVLVHCQAGVSRSPSLVLAYLMISRGMTLDGAWEFVQSARPLIHPNIGFARQLLNFYLDDLGGPRDGCVGFEEWIRANKPIQLGWK
jgi:protein-tyrosine phosphatase